MSDRTSRTGASAKRPLNLAKFVPESAPDQSALPLEDGPTLRLRRIASDIVEKKGVDSAAPSEAEYGLPLKEMLGVITHCYVRGIFCSKDIADVLREEPKLKKAFGRKLPNEAAIRAFRRHYATEIEEALENLYRAFPQGGPSPAAPDAAEGTLQLRRDAAARLRDAAHTDNTKGRIG